jgi:hypothetical protein
MHHERGPDPIIIENNPVKSLTDPTCLESRQHRSFIFAQHRRLPVVDGLVAE